MFLETGYLDAAAAVGGGLARADLNDSAPGSRRQGLTGLDSMIYLTNRAPGSSMARWEGVWRRNGWEVRSMVATMEG